jgi:hypothetical protein
VLEPAEAPPETNVSVPSRSPRVLEGAGTRCGGLFVSWASGEGLISHGMEADHKRRVSPGTDARILHEAQQNIMTSPRPSVRSEGLSNGIGLSLSRSRPATISSYCSITGRWRPHHMTAAIDLWPFYDEYCPDRKADKGIIDIEDHR